MPEAALSEIEVPQKKRKPRAKKGTAKPQAPTQYIVLAFTAADSWVPLGGNDQPEVWSAVGGKNAIKLARKKGETYEGGVFHAIPLSSWTADSNNLEIEVETKPVVTFK